MLHHVADHNIQNSLCRSVWVGFRLSRLELHGAKSVRGNAAMTVSKQEGTRNNVSESGKWYEELTHIFHSTTLPFVRRSGSILPCALKAHKSTGCCSQAHEPYSL